MAGKIVRMSGIWKKFGAVPVLHGVEFEISAGEVHILAGENGAGKSTLIKILGGVHTDFEGTIEIGGQAVRPGSPHEAGELGIAVIFQELSLVPQMTVADNIFLGRLMTRAGFVRDRVQDSAARKILKRLGIEIDASSRVEELSIAEQQLVEIAKALARSARVVVMDEPTSSLRALEVERLFDLIHDLKTGGCAIVYITHRMEEIYRIADRITVLRDGRRVGTAAAPEVPPARLLEWMIGAAPEQPPSSSGTGGGSEILRVERLTVRGHRGCRHPVDDVSFSLRSGEILGLAGLQGSGASELLMALFGAHGSRVHGRVFLNGRPADVASPRAAVRQGIALMTSDRKSTGLVLSLSLTANATLAGLPRLSPGGWRSPEREEAATRVLAQRLSIRASSFDLEVGRLSGGNQQKVALAKWLQTRPKLLLMDEPTRGIDIAAKHEIYRLLGELKAEGIGIVLITSELPELLSLSDRILVMHRGRISAEFTRGRATPALILEAAMSDDRSAPAGDMT